MNKNLHRIVFNAARGIRMVVAETAKSATKAGGTAPAVAATTLAAVLAAPLALAQIVADPNAPGNQRPTVLTAPNGVPLVNIQTPSAAGVSRNTYQQFDVNQNGAILNNSRSNVQTQLGGWVQGNPWLAQGSARVILNEVNSANPSYLRGYTEVAGQRAEVIIANPAGIQINGAGFINASTVTLTTGTPQYGALGSLDGYVVRGGTVGVEGTGLDLRSTDYAAILARAVTVNASVHANTLKVATGANQISADHNQAAPTTGVGTAPAYALDVSALGGMYANKITLVGTEAGLGVRNAGSIGASGASGVGGAGELVLDHNGWLSNSGTIQATGSVQVTAAGAISNNGTVYAHADTRLTSQGNISNTGLIAAQGNTSVQATGMGAQISSAANAVLAAGLTPSGGTTQNGNLTVSAADTVALHGQVIAAGQASIQGTSISLVGAQLSAHNANLHATAGEVDASRSTLSAQESLAVRTAHTLRTDGASLSAQQLQLSAASLSNIGGEILQAGTTDLNMGVLGDLDNRGGRIASNSTNLGLGAQTLNNTDGRIEHAGAGTLAITATTLEGARGQITGNGTLSLVANQVNHDGASTSTSRWNTSATGLGKSSRLAPRPPRSTAAATLQTRAAPSPATAKPPSAPRTCSTRAALCKAPTVPTCRSPPPKPSTTAQLARSPRERRPP